MGCSVETLVIEPVSTGAAGGGVDVEEGGLLCVVLLLCSEGELTPLPFGKWLLTCERLSTSLTIDLYGNPLAHYAQ